MAVRTTVAHPVVKAIGVLVLVFLAIQLIPYGHTHSNPPVQAEPTWNSPQTRALAVRACYACHSNETVWPWYTNIAPFSWLAQRDVDEGRRELNFSEWNRSQRGASEVVRQVETGEMPPGYYTVVQSKARLSSAETQALIQGLQATVRSSPPGSGQR